MKILRLRASMSDPGGVMIPSGVTETLTVEVADEVAVYYFKDSRITKKFATFEIEADKKKNKPQTTIFNERLGKAIKQYPGKTKEEVRDIILELFRKLNARIKK